MREVCVVGLWGFVCKICGVVRATKFTWGSCVTHVTLAFDENAGYRIRYPYIKSPYKIIMFSVFSVTGIV